MADRIVVRPFQAKDLSAIQLMHQSQNLGYLEPDWQKMLLSAVIEVNGQVTTAAFLRPTVESYLLFDPQADIRKRTRLGELLILHRELLRPAQKAGVEDVHCWLPPQIQEQFGPVLEHLGWRKQPWPCYAREVK